MNQQLTPHEIHTIAAYLRRLKTNHRKNGIDWQSVRVRFYDGDYCSGDKVYVSWIEDQGPGMSVVPCSDYILTVECDAQ